MDIDKAIALVSAAGIELTDRRRNDSDDAGPSASPTAPALEIRDNGEVSASGKGAEAVTAFWVFRMSVPSSGPCSLPRQGPRRSPILHFSGLSVGERAEEGDDIVDLRRGQCWARRPCGRRAGRWRRSPLPFRAIVIFLDAPSALRGYQRSGRVSLST